MHIYINDFSHLRVCSVVCLCLIVNTLHTQTHTQRHTHKHTPTHAKTHTTHTQTRVVVHTPKQNCRYVFCFKILKPLMLHLEDRPKQAFHLFIITHLESTTTNSRWHRWSDVSRVNRRCITDDNLGRCHILSSKHHTRAGKWRHSYIAIVGATDKYKSKGISTRTEAWKGLILIKLILILISPLMTFMQDTSSHDSL